MQVWTYPTEWKYIFYIISSTHMQMQEKDMPKIWQKVGAAKVPAEVTFLGQGAQSEVVLGVGTRGDVQIPLDLFAVSHFQLVDRLQGELRVDLGELAVPRTVRTRKDFLIIVDCSSEKEKGQR